MQRLPHDEIEKKVAQDLGTMDHVYYNTVENVIRAIDIPEGHLCTYCITGKNPFDEKTEPTSCEKQ
jgi:glutamine phosphoribosylpyrophosphate amidotransferase